MYLTLSWGISIGAGTGISLITPLRRLISASVRELRFRSFNVERSKVVNCNVMAATLVRKRSNSKSSHGTRTLAEGHCRSNSGYRRDDLLNLLFLFRWCRVLLFEWICKRVSAHVDERVGQREKPSVRNSTAKRRYRIGICCEVASI